jgi:sterol desaturase/sphingolipid hydroxylase (fatty acid hydroxylase superfamily)
MKKLLDLQPADLVTNPAEVVTVAWESLVRNFSAESGFYGLFFLAIAFGLAVDVWRGRSVQARVVSRAFRTDFFYALLEMLHLVQFTIIVPLAVFMTQALQHWAPWLEIRALAELPWWSQLFLQFLVIDFWVYWWHRVQHHSEVAWQFHKTHHSQTNLNAMTTFRQTIVDRIVTLSVLVVPGVMMKVDAVMPALIVTLLLIQQLIVHNDSGWSWGWLDRIFVSPAFHEVHHSKGPSHLNRNFGGVLSVWDHVFRTYAPRGEGDLTYGLVTEQLPESWWRQQLVPILGLWRLIRLRSGARAA